MVLSVQMRHRSDTTLEDTAGLDRASRQFLHFVANRDADVLNALLSEQIDRAYTQARRMLGSWRASEAEDAVQEAFLQLVRTADTYDGSIPFGAWLGRLVHVAALRVLRSRGRRRRSDARARDISAAQEAQAPDPIADEPDPSDRVRGAVLELPDNYRATIDLHYFAGLSQRDTAKALGMSENAVAKRLQRARECLRALLLRRGLAVGGGAIALALTNGPTYAASEAVRTTVRGYAASVASGAALPSTLLSAKLTAVALGGGWFLKAIAAGFVLACLATWHFGYAPKPIPAAPVSTPEPAVAAAEVAPQQAPEQGVPLPVSWSFDSEPTADLHLIGDWEWVPAELGCQAGITAKTGWGEDAIANGIGFIVPVYVGDKPVVATLKFHLLEEAHAGLGLLFGWVKNAHGGGVELCSKYRHWNTKNPYSVDIHQTSVIRFFVDKDAIIYDGGKDLIGLTIYDEEHMDVLALTTQGGVVVEGFEMHEAAPGEKPEKYREASRLTEDLFLNTDNQRFVITKHY